MRTASTIFLAGLWTLGCARPAAQPQPAPMPPALPAPIPHLTAEPTVAFALRQVEITIGTGALAEPRQCLYANYTGWLTDGTKFDSSRDTTPQGRPRTPISFPQGARRVIAGWDLGFDGMRVGGSRRLFIPYQLAYGERGRPPVIPPKAELVFDVELMAVADTLPTAPPAPGQRAPQSPACPSWETVAAAGQPGGVREAFWSSLAAMCGQAFEGRVTESNPPDTVMSRARLVMHVRTCTPDTLRIPFHVGEDRSRTWVITRAGSGLRLKHDHRHADGSEDAVTQYGGDTQGTGSITAQEFHADSITAVLVPAARTNIWTVEIVPGRRFVYALRRTASDRRVRVEFDLTRPVATPPAPW